MMLNYVGYWEEYGYRVPDLLFRPVDNPVELKVDDLVGKVIPWDILWGLLSRIRIMNLLSNITDSTGRSVIIGKKLQRVLELGCDYGHTWSCYESCFEEVYGVEISDHATWGDNLGHKIHHGDMMSIPYSDNYFDLVISAHSLEHAKDIDILLREVHRVTKPSGYSAHTLPCTPDNKPEGYNPTGIHQICIGYLDWKHKFIEFGFDVIADFFTWAFNQEEWNIIARKAR